MEKIVIGTREIVEYRGKCPDCGCKQTSTFSESYVDVPCFECGLKRKEVKIKEKYKHLIGGTVADVYGHDNLTAIIIKASDGKEYEIYSYRKFGDDDYLEVSKVEDRINVNR